MSDVLDPSPTIQCPSCKAQIKLNESLAAPLIAAKQREFEARSEERERAVIEREHALGTRLRELEAKSASVDEEVARKLGKERATLAAVEAGKARAALADEIDQSRAELAARDALLKERDAKLALARDKELELLKLKDRLETAAQEMELTVARRVQLEAGKAREDAQKKAEEAAQQKLAEMEKILADTRRDLADAQRRAEQGSQQLQGEIQELALEGVLRGAFPLDSIEPVPKGMNGADVVQRVDAITGKASGVILWESKNAKAFVAGWLSTLKDNLRAVKADLAILVTVVLPKGIVEFGQQDGVWICTPRSAVPLAACLRQLLADVASAHKSNDGLETKMELVYRYLTGPHFQQRLKAIVDGFTNMRSDLEKEKRVMNQQWAKREKDLERVMLASTGLYGDLKGIAGQTLQQIDDLELKALEAPAENDDGSAS